MFSLIISIISIALVAALAAATVYFGGAAFNKGGAGADASAFINAGQQIAGAFTLAETDGESFTTVAELSPEYLAQIPTYKSQSLILDATGGADYVAVEVSANVCQEIHERANGKGATLGAAAAFAATNLYGCQQISAAVTEITDTATDDYVAFYKVK